MHSSEFNFIVGIGRSGTSLLMSIFNSHTKVQSTPEINFFVFFYNAWKHKKKFDDSDIEKIHKYLKSYKNNHTSIKFDFDYFNKTENANFRELYSNFYKSLFYGNGRKECSHYFDKNPINTLHIDDIISVFPNAKFLLMTRDPRANYLSRKEKKNKRTSEIYYNSLRWDYYTKSAIHYYKKYPNNFFILKYEDLVNDPELWLKEIAHYFNFNFESSMLDFNKNIIENVIKANPAVNKEVRLNEKYSDLSKPINKERVNSWQAKLSKEEIDIINYITIESASFFGYDIHNRGISSANKIKLFVSKIKFCISTMKNYFENNAPLFLKLRAMS